ncbi:hypothetical protein Acr_07g0012040 [Actinidia rufa]|uniref:Uncharacterized protein n=1 Tax=Actinidia rufa TaxID=165716 RepID=A0A7J0EX73_9ERIC|nr:hypothetical protein Acr_07g0012040 [Actinidia rufa]
MAEVTLEVPEVIKRPPQVEGAFEAEDIPRVPEVFKEPPQIDQSKTWKMYIDGAKINLGIGARVVLKSSKGQFTSTS